MRRSLATAALLPLPLRGRSRGGGRGGSPVSERPHPARRAEGTPPARRATLPARGRVRCGASLARIRPSVFFVAWGLGFRDGGCERDLPHHAVAPDLAHQHDEGGQEDE